MRIVLRETNVAGKRLYLTANAVQTLDPNTHEGRGESWGILIDWEVRVCNGSDAVFSPEAWPIPFQAFNLSDATRFFDRAVKLTNGERV